MASYNSVYPISQKINQNHPNAKSNEQLIGNLTKPNLNCIQHDLAGRKED